MSTPGPDSGAGMVDGRLSVVPPAAAPSPDNAAGMVDDGVSVVPPANEDSAEMVDGRIPVVPPASPDSAAGMVDGGVSVVPPADEGSGGMVDGGVSVVPPADQGIPGMVDGRVPVVPAAAAPGPDSVAGMVDRRVSAIPPAARRLQGRRAGLITRLLANTVDFGVAVAIVAGGYAGVAALRFLWNSRTFTFPAPGFGVLLIAGGAVMTLYLTACWTVSGRTFGDHLLGLRVLGLRGGHPRPVVALLRAVLCVLFPIGLFWIVVSRDNRSVQDVLLRSSVVYDWSRTPLSGSR